MSTVDPSATEAGLKVLRRGGNAVDAAAAAALGVTEPFSSGVGGGGFFVYYDASSGRVRTIDGREEAPAAMPRDAFVDPETAEPYPFYPERVTGGASVGVPGTLATWQRALDLWGTIGLKRAFRPAIKIANRGFVVDRTFRPTELPVPAGYMTLDDLSGYRTYTPEPTHVEYRGYDVFGMAPPSSGGSTVGEALNILENFDLGALPRGQALHRYLESTALAFADRNAYLGDDRYVDVPLDEVLSQGFAEERSCLIDPTRALRKPVAPGMPDGSYDRQCGTAGKAAHPTPRHRSSTTHLTVADRWGNVVSYTLTIEQIGGSAMTVPGWGFLLNNELTDFTADPDTGGPNLVAGGKRPRSSMAPTIVLRDGGPAMALGTPGGTTIITTVA